MMTDPQDNACALTGIECHHGIGLGERERLFAVQMLAGGRDGFYLRAMLGVGCRKQHGLNRYVGQHLVERCSKRNLMLDREIANRIGLERDAAHEAQRRAEVARCLDQRLAPPTEANDRRIDHRRPYTAAGAPGCLSGCARAKASILFTSSTMRFTVGYGARSHLK